MAEQTGPSTYEVLGRIGLPAPVSELAARRWDAVVVGGGHNGLTAAAYLARAGRAVLVLERRQQLGGACTLEQPFADPRFLVSPCAYLVGLLHPFVIDELDLPRYGYRTFVCDPTQWTPFEDGTSLTQWRDQDRTTKEVHALAAGDVDGYLAYDALFARIRARLRAGGDPGRDTWLGDAPDRADLEQLFADDAEARDVLFDASIADVVERHVRDPRLRTALHGQGIIGTFAGPRDPGTAWIHAMHSLGLIGGWSYVEGGMGRVSFCLADAARDSGAVLATGVPVAAIVPGEGVRLEGGELIRASAVISNADPVRTLALCDGEVPDDFRARVGAWRCESPVVKLNCALDRLPTFTAAPSRPDRVYRAQVEIGRGIDETQAAYDACRRGEPAPEWCELYFQTPYDPSVAPPGAHTMSVFAQYAPYTLAAGTWDTRRDEIADAVLDAIARFAPDVAGCVVEREVLGPPDVEARIGLTGGHIFQGECLPDQMWDRRFAARTPIPSVYLCGAATHPGGSVIAVNGRNAAHAVLADLGAREA
ncbi:MAG: NAD(P)/FAD-dependent oxidoreductase [Actinomycetota bacterium]|nr:NAD(P)/FAD-dependent oxidoreductase [Actinomycetota bacterium]